LTILLFRQNFLQSFVFSKTLTVLVPFPIRSLAAASHVK
jgi:hypothetical protein